MKNPYSLINKRTVIMINRMAIELTGGMGTSGSNIRQGQNLGFIEQIARNEVFGQTLYVDIFEMAAAYFFYIIKNHVFIDGNKRTALATAITFLNINGIEVAPMNEENVFEMVMAFAAEQGDPGVMIPAIASEIRNVSLL